MKKVQSEPLATDSYRVLPTMVKCLSLRGRQYKWYRLIGLPAVTQWSGSSPGQLLRWGENI